MCLDDIQGKLFCTKAKKSVREQMHKKYYLVLFSLVEINFLIPECSVMIMQGDITHSSLVAFTN